MKSLTFKRTYRNYLTFISGLAELTNREIDLLEAVYSLNLHQINSTTKKLISDKLGVTEKTLNIMLRTLYGKKALNKEGHGIYTVNPILKDINDLTIKFNG